ncbi:hypothetical protein NITHO_4360005 [Nitrolancea hollandica Lb]|uniref:Uncharacterized protein n=1 Tax=Nitrolancea hollandica Lb TaxID=1129897 RepID=I4EK23_9BACT|nr:hypothetical protein NITHO_4360005 [Nitrolancea hollandica Lb]
MHSQRASGDGMRNQGVTMAHQTTEKSLGRGGEALANGLRW